jgi:hypothetical protein
MLKCAFKINYFIILAILLHFADCFGKSEKSKVVPLNVEVSEKVENSTLYQLSVEDFPTSTMAILYLTRMDNTWDRWFTYVNEKGEVMVVNDKGMARLILAGGFGYGETADLQLVPCDKKSIPIRNPAVIAEKKGFAMNPLEVSDTAGHKIIIIAGDKRGFSFSYYITGFQPCEEICLIFNTCDQETKHITKVDNEGKFDGVTYPKVKERRQGPFAITVQAKNMEPLILTHYWGELAFKCPYSYVPVSEKYPNFMKNG